MRILPEILSRNRRAVAMTAEDPEYFSRLCEIQAPEFLRIGCADSRVPSNEIVGLAPGELSCTGTWPTRRRLGMSMAGPWWSTAWAP